MMLMAGDLNGNGKNSVNNKLTIWLKAIAIIGVPGVIALFLVWTGANSLPAIEREVLLNRQETQRNRELLEQQIEKAQELYRLMQRICANAAKNAQERSACFDSK